MQRRGSILIVTLWVVIALTGLALTLAYSMRIEAIAGANRAAQAQAEAAERGMEQLLIAAVDAEMSTPGSLQSLSLEGRQIGNCLVWVVRPDWDADSQQLTYALSDEAGKLNLNTATAQMLLNLPGMTQDVADSILDWRSPATAAPHVDGAKDTYYLDLGEGYHCKNGPFETVEELLLVKGVTKDLLFGYDRNRNGILDAAEQQTGGLSAAVSDAGTGIYPFITVYAAQAASGGQSLVDINNPNVNSLQSPLRSAGLSDSRISQITRFIQPPRRQPRKTFANVFDFYFQLHDQGLLNVDEFKKVLPRLTGGTTAATGPSGAAAGPKINVNTASAQVLMCLPQIQDSDAAAIISHRQSLNADPTDISWLATTLSRQKAVAIGSMVTGKSNVFSGDIVAVSPDGRAFIRCRVVIRGTTTPSQIIYRRDLTASGWPLPPEIRAAIRSGQGYEAPAPATNSPKGGMSL